MKNLIWVIFSLLFFASCSTDDTPTKQTQHLNKDVPFNTLWISTRFDIPSRISNDISDFEFLNTWSYYDETEQEPTTDYRYYNSLYNELNVENSIIVNLSENTLTVKIEGVMPRIGDDIPEGSTDNWPLSVDYTLEIVCNPVAKTITSAVLKMNASDFSNVYDLKPILMFREYDQYGLPEWSIANDTSKESPFAKLRIAVAVDDVIGTAIKN